MGFGGAIGKALGGGGGFGNWGSMLGIGGGFLGGSLLSSMGQSGAMKDQAGAWDKAYEAMKLSPEEKKALRERAMQRINMDYLAAKRGARKQLASRGLGGGALAGMESDFAKEEAAAKAGVESAVELADVGKIPGFAPTMPTSTSNLMMGNTGDIAQYLSGLLSIAKIFGPAAAAV